MAYDQLLAEGYIQAEPCRVFLYAISRNCTGFGKQRRRNGTGHRPEKPVCLVDFSPYAIDTRSFPYNVWRKISRNVLLDDSEELLMAGDGQGEYSLRSEIADYLHHARGVNCRRKTSCSEPEMSIWRFCSRSFSEEIRPCSWRAGISAGIPHLPEYGIPGGDGAGGRAGT